MRQQAKTDSEAVTEITKRAGTASCGVAMWSLSTVVRWKVVLLLAAGGIASIVLMGCGDSGTQGTDGGSVEQEATPGYGNDLATAVSAARSDLAAGKAEKFATGMFPPSTIAMIKAEGRWDSTLEHLATDAPRAEAIVNDLQILETLQPVIDGGTATFTLDRIVTKANRNGGESFKDGERTIRFSLIDGDWRFFDNTRNVASMIHVARLEHRLQKARSPWRLK